MTTQVQTEMLGTGSVSSTNLAANAVTTTAIAAAAVTPAKLSQPFTSGTAQSPTSGTAIDFTGIPSWARKITLAIAGLTKSSTGNLLLQFGGGAIDTTGYASGANSFNTALSPGFLANTTGIILWSSMAANYVVDGVIELVNVTGNLWTTSGSMINEVGTVSVFGGKHSTSAALDRVRITTTGTDTFSAGSVNIYYE